AEPAVGAVVRDWVCSCIKHVTGDQDVLSRKEYIDIPVRVSLPQVSILDFLFTEGHLPGGVEGLVRKSGRRARLVDPFLPLDVDFGSKPQLCVLVLDDFRSGFLKRLVRTGVLPMPVRIEENLYRLSTRMFADQLQQVWGMLRETSIYQQQSIG